METFAAIPELLPWVWPLIVGAVLFYFYWNRTFNDTITYGVQWTTLVEGSPQLHLRTPVDVPMDDVLPKNVFFRFALTRAIAQCSEQNPLVRMSPSDMNILQPRIINKLSELCGDGIMAKLAGLPTVTHTFYVAVVFETPIRDGARSAQVEVPGRSIWKHMNEPSSTTASSCPANIVLKCSARFTVLLLGCQ